MPRVIGKDVGPIGYGLMGMLHLAHLNLRPSIRPSRHSKQLLESGLTLWNGAEFYGTPDCNSMTLMKAYFTKYPEDADKVTLVIKGSMDITTHKLDGSPEGTRRSLDNIIKQLGGTKKLDGFAPSRRDPQHAARSYFWRHTEGVHQYWKTRCRILIRVQRLRLFTRQQARQDWRC
ncbi:hypothetical protein J3459_004020 [Metarhizium acridum]|nr:hypothetical protein J3459_004020 [Metarhizium acridum]